MRETIILANNISENEKLKSLSSFNHTSFNKRYMSAIELAEYLLQLSGVSHHKQFIQNDIIAASIYLKIKSNKYFLLYSYNDVLNLVNTIQDLRYHIPYHEEDIYFKLPNDIFKEKNEALLEAYKTIKETLGNDCIDEVGVVRFAVEHTDVFPNIEFVSYNHKTIRPLEKLLLEKASGNKVSYKKLCNDKTPLVVSRYTKAFGQTNEIEDIINYIYTNKIHFDECLIVSPETNNYANILTNYQSVLSFPLTIGVGKKIAQTNPGKLYSLLIDWKHHHYRYEYLLRIINDESFDLGMLCEDLGINEELLEKLNEDLHYQYQISLESIIEIVGRLKIGIDTPEENIKRLNAYEALVLANEKNNVDFDETSSRVKSLPFVKMMTAIITSGFMAFINRYSVILNKKEDLDAVTKIMKALTFKTYGVPDYEIEDIILNQSLSRNKVEEGSLYFTSIHNASSCLRKHLFIVGLSSNNFPGKSVENPLLLDRDYEAFGVNEASNREINKNKEDLELLLDEAKENNVNIYLSWASYNSETLKSQNPSSQVFEIFKQEEGNKDKTISDFNGLFKRSSSYEDKYRIIEYFNNDLLPINKLGRDVVKYKDIPFEPVIKNDEEQKVVFDELKKRSKGYGFSASMVTSYAECPYMFFLQCGLKVEQPEDIDVYEIIAGNEYGTLAHGLLEKLDKKKTSRDKFLKIAEARFNDYLVCNVPDNEPIANKTREEFVEMMGIAYDMENQEITKFREQDLSTLHKESGVKIHGFPDKVVEKSDGTYHVVDYKTGRKIRHNVFDKSSMVQCTMYSYILEKTQHVHVSSFEYRYIRLNTRVMNIDMNEHYADLTNTLNKLKASIESGEFLPNHNHCGDCYYRDVCRKKKK